MDDTIIYRSVFCLAFPVPQLANNFQAILCMATYKYPQPVVFSVQDSALVRASLGSSFSTRCLMEDSYTIVTLFIFIDRNRQKKKTDQKWARGLTSSRFCNSPC